MNNKTLTRHAAADSADAAIDGRIPRSLADLPAGTSVPENAVCVFVSGSLVAGWGHAASDIDIYVVTDQPVRLESTAAFDLSSMSLNLTSDPIPVVTAYSTDGSQRYDIEYWTTGQVQAMLDAVARGRDDHPWLNPKDIDCFYRIKIGLALTGTAWLRDVQERLTASALPLLLAKREFDDVDDAIEDTVGLMEVGDHHSAVLAARQALGHAIDGYLAAQGSISPKAKWRYRKLLELPDSRISPDEYWGLETMRELDPADPQDWVNRVIEVCNALIMEVDFS